MKIAFVQETVNQNIGIEYLSAILKSKGHECELFIEPLENDLPAAIRSFSPDIIGFGVITGAHRWALEKAGHLKKILPRSLIIIGGPHPTYFPEMIHEPAVDAIARGEAEISFLELVTRISDSRDYSDVQGLWLKINGNIYRNDPAPLVEDVSSLPFPDHALYLKYAFFKNQTEVPFIMTRGCPFNCSFCYNHVKMTLYRSKGRYLRTRSVEHVISEMELARKLYPNMRSVIMHDDTIGLDKKWLADFSSEYRRRVNMPWFISIRADFADEFTVEQLRLAGCFCLSVGVETGDEYLREKILGKKISDASYIRAAGLIHKAGIKLRTSNMLFLPEEDIDKAMKTVDLNRKMRVDFPWAYTLQPYPGTAIYDYALKNGSIPAGFHFDDIDPLGLVKPIIKTKDRDKIMVLHRLFYLSVKNGFMRKILGVLVLVPPNFLFEGLYYFSLVQSYAEYHQVSFLRAFKVALSNFKGLKKPAKAKH